MKTQLSEYFPFLIAGNLPGLRELFSAEPWIDDPRLGAIRGWPAFERFAAESRDWLRQIEARAGHTTLTSTPQRVIVERLLHLKAGGEPVVLPVAAVGDVSGEGFLRLRVYHSLWPLNRRHSIRPPLLPNDPALKIPGVIGRYQDALAAGDLEKILEQFEPDGYAREPSGGPYIYQGSEKLRQFYSLLFEGGAGIPLEHCTATDDGVRCAIEYNVTRLGGKPIPAQSGVGVYERGKNGLLAAARIYDDVDVPS